MKLLDKLRATLDTWQAAPNPILIRELRQDARLVRTPWMIMGVIMMLALFIASFGTQRILGSRSEFGMGVFQGLFIVAFFAMSLAGPALTANAVAAEREGRTWEALLLTGMTPRQITRGKFLASATSLGIYVIASIPVSALSFLFGGVQWYELLIGFFYLFWATMLTVAFGLAVSSRMTQSRNAIVLTLVVSVPLSGALFGLLGPGAAAAVGELWPQIPRTPYWLPLAYGRADFGFWYLVVLVLAPAFTIGFPLWGLYEAALANLTEPTDDRSTGLKIWFTAFALASTIIGVAVIIGTSPGSSASGRGEVAITTIAGLLLAAITGLFVLVADPLGASRRVRRRWELEGVGRVRRWFGPGYVSTTHLVLLLAGISVGVLLVTAVVSSAIAGGGLPKGVLPFTAYAVAFFVFMVGLATALRARSNNGVLVRVLLFAFVVGVTLIPVIVAGVLGVVAGRPSDFWIIAAPSPIFIGTFVTSTGDAETIAGWAAAAAWLIVGLALQATGRDRIGAILLDFDERFAASDRMYRDEDAALQESLAQAPAEGAQAEAASTEDASPNPEAPAPIEDGAPSAEATPPEVAPTAVDEPKPGVGGGGDDDAAKDPH